MYVDPEAKFGQGWSGLALVSHKPTNTKYCRQGEFKPQCRGHDRGQTDNSHQLHWKTQGNRQKLPLLGVDDFVNTAHLKQGA
jgi:hypothetical protein